MNRPPSADEQTYAPSGEFDYVDDSMDDYEDTLDILLRMEARQRATDVVLRNISAALLQIRNAVLLQNRISATYYRLYATTMGEELSEDETIMLDMALDYGRGGEAR